MRRKNDRNRAIDGHVGRQLRKLRTERGLTQTQLANTIGVSHQQLHQYETGANSLAASQLHGLAVSLGINIELFFEGLANTVTPANDAPQPEQFVLARKDRALIQQLNSLNSSQRSKLSALIRSFAAAS